ncbi:type IV pilin N-terminal domain-containing protein [Haloarcula litorea]|uniref:type IV pilin N-terminal domain-containing protein n=1 Tax=Haloarcula litorea TaxID=3032579 RepID=UPI0023E85576|nr:type IV pilin N-terminal domain-containing protein [Halomicroarcula sp. GDY20]
MFPFPIPGPPDRRRAVSPVVGVVLMAGIVVVLAAVVGSLAVGFEGELREPAPTGSFERAFVATGADNTNDRPYVVVTHELGRTVEAERVYIRDESGNTVRWDNVWTGGPEVHAGEYVHIDGFQSDGALDPICEAGQTYRIIVTDGDGRTLLLNEWTAPTDPQLPPSSSHDDDGDGIPNWCPNE